MQDFSLSDSHSPLLSHGSFWPPLSKVILHIIKLPFPRPLLHSLVTWLADKQHLHHVSAFFTRCPRHPNFTHFNFIDRVWLFVLLPKVDVIPASLSVIFLRRSKDSPRKAVCFKTHFTDIRVWITVVLCDISSFEPTDYFTGC